MPAATSSGVPILDGLEITAKTAGNTIIEDAIMAVRKAVEEAVRWFAGEGATPVPIELPNQKLGVPVYYVIAPADIALWKPSHMTSPRRAGCRCARR